MTEEIPLPNVVYSRTKRQYQNEERGIQKLTFYIRGMDRQKEEYNSKIKQSNQLFVLGIWNWDIHSEDNPPSEWAFSTKEDQLAMFRLVFDNIVKIDERRRFVSDIKEIIDQHGEQIKLEKAEVLE